MKKILLISILFLVSITMFANNRVPRVVRYNGLATPDNVIEVYGHRGVRSLVPEQTMPAYKAALRIGVDYVDMDINMTEDGVLVITHNLGLNPDITKNGKGKWIMKAKLIYKLTLNQVRKYDVGDSKPGTEYAKLFPYQEHLDNVKIPTLVEAIKYVKKIAGNKVGFQIEIKNDPTKPEDSATPKEYAVALYKILKDENIIDRSEIQAFDWRCLIELNKLDPNVKTAYLTDHTTETLTDSETGIWMAGLKPKDFNYSFPQMVKHLGGYCWEPFMEDLTKKDLDEAHKLGIKVVPWGWVEEEKTDFDTSLILKMISWKVDGIISDRPDILRGILASRDFNVPEGFYIEN